MPDSLVLVAVVLVVLASLFGLFLLKVAADNVARARREGQLHRGWTLDATEPPA